MVTASSGSLMFRGQNSGTTYVRAFYWADAIGTMARIDNGNGTPGATGGADFTTFDEPVVLYDISVVTGPTVALNGRIMANYNPTAYMFNWATHVNTLNYRPVLNIPFKAGTRISILPLA